MKTRIIVSAAFVAGVAGGFLVAAQKPESPGLPAERVTGVGGIFFKAQDPRALAAWYREKLGVPVREDGEFAVLEWRDREDPTRVGATVWSVFSSDSPYFAPSRAPFMINYRVRDLDRMLAQLRAMSVAVEPVREEFNGKFAWVVDPEGNKIELWEPKAGY